MTESVCQEDNSVCAYPRLTLNVAASAGTLGVALFREVSFPSGHPTDHVCRRIPMAEESEVQYISARQSALRERLKVRKLGGLVVSSPSNVFYLTGFRGSDGLAFFTARNATLLVDPRYTLQAREQTTGVEVVEVRNGLLRAGGEYVRKAKVKRPGYEDTNLSVADFEVLRRAGPRLADWVPVGGIIEELRVIKDHLEIERIRRAGLLTAQVFQDIEHEIRPGVSESDLAAEVEYRMRRRGADGAAFETIVACGPHGALPHARPGASLLSARQLVIFDLGAILSGYAADMTRTVYLGAPDGRTRARYQAVLKAQEQGIRSVRAGVEAQAIDGATRTRLAKNNLAKYFTHATGHGVGIEIHERPRLAKGEKRRLSLGTVVTVEPGIYLEGWGGIRIEDTVLVGRDSAEILTPAAKDRWWFE